MPDNEIFNRKERIKQLEQKQKTIKSQFNEEKKTKLQNFKIEKKTKLQEIRKEQGKISKEVQEEFKQKEQALKEEIAEMEQEMEQEITALKEEIKSIRSQKMTPEEKQYLKENKKINKQNIKDGEKILKDIIGTKLKANAKFFVRLKGVGISTTKLWPTWYKIHDHVIKELKDGTLKSEDVERRVDELIKEISPNHIVITETQIAQNQVKNTKSNIIKKGKLQIQIPYQTGGVNDAIMGGAFIGGWGTTLGRLNEGKIRWNTTELILLDEGINVKATGQVIIYKDIDQVILGEKGRLFRTVTVITNSRENLVFKTGNLYAEASKEIIENYARIHKPNTKYKIPKKETPNLETNQNEADTLLKYAELYEKGLLTKEEFEFKKSELLGIPTNNQINEENKDNFCPNCGNKLEPNSKFCSKCGFNLN